MRPPPAYRHERNPYQSGERTEVDAEQVADHDALRLDEKHGQVGVDAGNAGRPGEWIDALGHQLGTAVAGQQGHHHEGLPGADGEVHRAADGGDVAGLPGVPVGQVAGGRDLVGAEHADVQMAAAHHRERVGVMEVRRARQLGHRELARVDQVRIDLVAQRLGAHAEHAVLGVQHDAAVRRQMVGDRGRQADAEVDERTGRDVRRDDARQRVPVDTGQRAHCLSPDRARSRSRRTTRSTYRHGVTTCSGSSAPAGTIWSTCAIVVAAAAAMIGPKLRAVLLS
jgi:hypothetical protein